MGLFDAFTNPYKSTVKGYKKARNDFQQTRGVTDPFYNQMVSSGSNAQSMLSDFLGLNGTGSQQDAFSNFSTSPAFQFNFDQGQRAIDSSAAARGMSKSGDTLKALQGFGQGLYNQEYRNYLNDLSGMVQGGMGGAGGLTDNSQIWGNLRIGQGQAQDMNRQAGLANVLGLAGTVLGTVGNSGLGSGMSGQLGKLFGNSGQMPTYYGTNKVNPYGIF